jgi:hypothetical protein
MAMLNNQMVSLVEHFDVTSFVWPSLAIDV